MPVSASPAASLYDRVRHVIPPVEWPIYAEDIDAILALKRERNAIILAHNYQTPEIFHCVADIVGDSLALARKATNVDADVIVLAGVPMAGVSAGANVAGLLIGTTNDFPVAEIPTRDALGIFPAVINPHHPTPDTKAEHDGRIGKISIYLKFNPDQTVLGLANASLARLHGGKVTLKCGRAWLYQGKTVREVKAGEEIPELATKR